MLNMIERILMSRKPVFLGSGFYSSSSRLSFNLMLGGTTMDMTISSPELWRVVVLTAMQSTSL